MTDRIQRLAQADGVTPRYHVSHRVTLEWDKPCYCCPLFLSKPSLVLSSQSCLVQWVERHCCARGSPLPSLLPQKKSKVHYHIAVIINYLGHCISLVALLVAFVLFLRLR